MATEHAGEGFPLCEFIFSAPSASHQSCVPKHCLSIGGEICATEGLKSFLSDQTTAYDRYKSKNEYQSAYPILEKAHDWNFLEWALKSQSNPLSIDAMKFFSSNRSYRLRYRSHKDLGIQFVKIVLSKHSFFFQPTDGVWNLKGPLGDRVNRYLQTFISFCRLSESSSCSGLYRLYDLCEGRSSLDKIKITRTHFLSLLFAFAYGEESELISCGNMNISDLVAKYEFFKALTEEGYYYMQKRLGIINSTVDAVYLSSPNWFAVAKNLWEALKQTGARIGTESTALLIDNPRVKKGKCNDLTSKTPGFIARYLDRR